MEIQESREASPETELFFNQLKDLRLPAEVKLCAPGGGVWAFIGLKGDFGGGKFLLQVSSPVVSEWAMLLREVC